MQSLMMHQPASCPLFGNNSHFLISELIKHLYVGQTIIFIILTMSQQIQNLFASVKKTILKNNESQLFYKAFLRPKQIALKTGQTQHDPKKYSCMPYGLKQVERPSVSDNKFFLNDFPSFDEVMNAHPEDFCYEIARENGCCNLVSLMKPRKELLASKGIKVAICICMYSEDKSMLKRSLTGVSQNIEEFVKDGYTYDEIGVFVIMDGIEVVDESVESFFQELEKDHSIFLSNDIEPAKNEELLELDREFQDQLIENVNHLTFNPEEYDEFKSMRFIARKKQYILHKEMIKNIEKLEINKNVAYQDLDGVIQRFYLDKAREKYKSEYAASEDDLKSVSEQTLLEMYAENRKTSAPIIKQALAEAKKYCQEYITSRDNLALMTPFRVAISLPDVKRNEIEGDPNNYAEMVEEDEDVKSSILINMNLFFITKYKNRGKLTSHNWFFNGFCAELKPKYAILLDVGLVPEKNSLVKMCTHMEKNEEVGGVCGYMGLRIEKLEEKEEVNDDDIDFLSSLFLRVFDIQRAQQFEYHFAHLIDKPFQACFKFIHVLPGAFSAYRMAAIRPEDQKQSRILREYFKSIESNPTTRYFAEPYSFKKAVCKVVLPDFVFHYFFGRPDPNSYERLMYDENVYLAEDRTLCLGIHQNGFGLTFLPDASAWVDPIKTLYGILGQRKRWINGSYFAFEKVKEKLSATEGEGPLEVQIFYLTLMNSLAFLSPALFMFTIHIAMNAIQSDVILPTLYNLGVIFDKGDVAVSSLFVYIIDLIYVLVFLGLVFFSMHVTNREKRFKTFFYGVSTFYGLLSICVFGVLISDIIGGFINPKSAFLIQNKWFVEKIIGGEDTINSIRYIMLSIIALYTAPVVIFLFYGRFQFVIDIVFSTLSFIFYNPTYMNIMNIYALCRMDDISWGTKGLNSDGSDRKKEMSDDWKKIKLLHVSKFVFYNMVFGFILISAGENYATRFWFTEAIMVLLTMTLAIKVVPALVYMFFHWCTLRRPVRKDHLDIKDLVLSKFNKVKNSMYDDIKTRMEQLFKEVAESSPMNRYIGSMILIPSKIQNNLRYNRKKQTYKKQNSWDHLSQIYKSKISKVNKIIASQKVQSQVENDKHRQIGSQLKQVPKTPMNYQFLSPVKDAPSQISLFGSSPNPENINTNDVSLNVSKIMKPVMLNSGSKKKRSYL